MMKNTVTTIVRQYNYIITVKLSPNKDKTY